MSDEHQVGDIWTGEDPDGRPTTRRVTAAVAPTSSVDIWLIALDGGDLCHLDWWYGQGYDGPNHRARIAEIEAERDTLRSALQTINEIRNSIVGCQTVNFSEHVYPLVAALDGAGFAGEGYPASRANMGTLIERAVSAERERDALRARVAELEKAVAAAVEALGEHREDGCAGRGSGREGACWLCREHEHLARALPPRPLV